VIPIRDTIPTRTRPVVNTALIVINVLAFLFELSMGSDLDAFIRTFGLVPTHVSAALARHDYAAIAIWTLASMFLHGGWLHLGGNMLYLWIFGDNVEDALGHGLYVVFYFACGIAAAAAHVVFNAGSTLPTVGASGAIAGVLGAYLVMYPRARVVTLLPIFFYVTFIEVPAPIYLGLWFVMQVLSGTAQITHATRHAVEGAGGVAWFAHAGGFICGVLLAFLLPKRARPAIYDEPPRFSRRRYGW